MPRKKFTLAIVAPPFETAELRRGLAAFLNASFPLEGVPTAQRVGAFKWGVYAFFDYDGEPIYVGQTSEQIRKRIGRHLTNQRSDAVAMSVLDPFEVCEIEVWPLPEYQQTSGDDPHARLHLDELEYVVTRQAVEGSKFKAVLNEKDPCSGGLSIELPRSLRGCIISDEVRRLRAHPDFRIARRALTISRLAQVISERKVKGGLRRALVTQAKRLQWLAEKRYEALGGSATVESEEPGEDT